MRVLFSVLIVFSLMFFIGCNENKDTPQEEEYIEIPQEGTIDYKREILPSIAGYIDSTAQSSLNRIVSSEIKSDNKSKFVAVIYELSNGDLESLNFHFEGEYIQEKLSIQHPFIVSCECDENCKNCGFKTTDEGVICGCMADVDSPCNLKVSTFQHIDFYETFHERGYAVLTHIGFH